VVCVSGRENAHRDVVQDKKVSTKSQQDIHLKQSRQSNQQRKVVKLTAYGKPMMNKKNWKQKVAKFAFNLFANAAMLATLNAGMSVAP
jgi:hypothetical protein